jgi:hypothetical protein
MRALFGSRLSRPCYRSIIRPHFPLYKYLAVGVIILGMKKRSSETHKAAQLLGKRGGMVTLKKHGPEKLREWGKLGADFGKLGGRPSNTKKGKSK